MIDVLLIYLYVEEGIDFCCLRSFYGRLLFKRYLLLLHRMQILGEYSSTLYLYTTIFRTSWPRYIMPLHSTMSYLSNYHFMNDHPFHFFSYRTSSHTDYVYVQYTHTQSPRPALMI